MFFKIKPEQAKYICQKMNEVGDHFALVSIENRSVMYLSPRYYLEHTVEECVAEIKRRIAAGEVTPAMVNLPSEGYVRPYIDPEEDEIIQMALQCAMADNMIVRLMGEDVDVSNLIGE